MKTSICNRKEEVLKRNRGRRNRIAGEHIRSKLLAREYYEKKLMTVAQYKQERHLRTVFALHRRKI